MSLLRDFQAAGKRSGNVVTTTIVVLLILGFLATWGDTSREFFFRTAFFTNLVGSQPWTFLTYPLANMDFVSILFSCLWLWGIGGIVERMDGPKRFAIFWLAMTALCAVGLWLGSLVLQKHAILSNAWTPIAAVTVVWGTRRPTDQMLFMFVVPITARWMAWISVALVFFGCRDMQMQIAPTLAPFAAAPLLLAWIYARGALPAMPGVKKDKSEFVRGAGFYSKEYFDDVKRREQAREEKERLKKLFESGDDDAPDG